MRNKKYIAAILVLSLIINLLYSYIDENTFFINSLDLTFSNEELRAMHVELTAEQLSGYAEECSLPLGEYMAVLMVKSGCKLNIAAAEELTPHEAVKLRNRLMRLKSEEFRQLAGFCGSVVTDMQYFPVPVSAKGYSWVDYYDSWGGERTYGGERTHEGTDIMAKNNVAGIYPVVSVSSGTVTNLGWLELGGWRVGITSDSGIYYYYAHLDSYADIKVGDTVKAGDLLGFMGNSGYSKVEGTKGKFDVHLHFGIYFTDKNGNEISLNPYYLLRIIENKVLYYQYGM